MFIIFISKLQRRKGGGGRGGSSAHESSSNSASSASSAGEIGEAATISSSSSVKTIKSYNNGGGKATIIPSGQPFAGRTAGGGIRGQVVGTRTYGSGYPGITGRGVADRGFPFFFWPVVWQSPAGVAVYHDTSEYGDPDNTSRPGGAMMTASFTSTSSASAINTFRIVADNATIIDLLDDLRANCSSYYSMSPAPAISTYNASGPPVPEQAVQYYRASSAVLTLDGYNNSAVFSANDNATDSALPSSLDAALLGCLNYTIGAAIPLVDGAEMLRAVGTLQLLVVFLGIMFGMHW